MYKTGNNIRDFELVLAKMSVEERLEMYKILKYDEAVALREFDDVEDIEQLKSRQDMIKHLEVIVCINEEIVAKCYDSM